MDDARKNFSGCDDPTAYQAIIHIERERVMKLRKRIAKICAEEGYQVYGKIKLLDIESGKIWR